MSQYLIKVLIEDRAIVYRDILINPNLNLEELHNSIKNAFDFNGKEFASFIKDDESLGAEIEIPLENLGEEAVSLMKEVKINEVLNKVGDQLNYTYDYASEWKFFLELIEINNEKSTKTTVIKKHGIAPKESDRNITGDDAEKILMNAILGDELSDDEFDDDYSDEFDSLDDYEDYI